MDLPFSLERYISCEGLSKGHYLLSSYDDDSFGVKYGALMRRIRPLNRLLMSSIFVLDEKNRITYARYYSDQGEISNLDELIDVAEKVGHS